ncbi:Hypothetical protein A7982_10719 [Minicystis rosea]|nr:Hypothetical protein A7982_10719 [Minicystis rosea]
MVAFFSSGRFARVVALGIVLAPATAHAQVPASPAPQAPPGYALPQGHPPGAHAPYAMPMPWGPGAPAVETTRRSSRMMGLGIALLAAGGTGVIIGSSMFAAGNAPRYPDVIERCDDEGPCALPAPTKDLAFRNAGLAVLIVGAAAVVAGLPLTIVGAQQVPVKTSAFVPEAHGHGLRWRF